MKYLLAVVALLLLAPTAVALNLDSAEVVQLEMSSFEMLKPARDIHELAYDPNPDDHWYDSSRMMDVSGAEWVVRFSPAQSCSLIHFCLATCLTTWNSYRTGEMQFVIYGGSSVGPTTPITEPASIIARHCGWDCIELDPPLDMGAEDFFLGVKMSQESPYMLFNIVSEASGRSWYRNPTMDWDWWEDLELHIRAYVTLYSPTGILEEETACPEKFELLQNYPNPFNAGTTISYTLPVPGEASLSVYNILGQEIFSRDLGYREAGLHQVRWDTGGLPSGVYFYRLEAGEWTQEKKMTLLK